MGCRCPHRSVEKRRVFRATSLGGRPVSSQCGRNSCLTATQKSLPRKTVPLQTLVRQALAGSGRVWAVAPRVTARRHQIHRPRTLRGCERILWSAVAWYRFGFLWILGTCQPLRATDPKKNRKRYQATALQMHAPRPCLLAISSGLAVGLAAGTSGPRLNDDDGFTHRRLSATAPAILPIRPGRPAPRRVAHGTESNWRVRSGPPAPALAEQSSRLPASFPCPRSSSGAFPAACGSAQSRHPRR